MISKKLPFIVLLLACFEVLKIKCFSVISSSPFKEHLSCKKGHGNIRIQKIRIQSSSYTSVETNIPSSTIIKTASYQTIIPFLSEHIQLSDQLLFVGAATNLALLLSKNGYGTKKNWFHNMH